MENKEKFKISIIDFMPHNGKIEVGKDKNGVAVCLGDMVKRHDGDWFVSYRYGNVVLKQPGMAMIGSTDFKNGDFSSVEKLNVFGAASDWLIIGYTDEPMYEKLKPLLEQ
jgi:hypothetical protein